MKGRTGRAMCRVHVCMYTSVSVRWVGLYVFPLIGLSVTRLLSQSRFLCSLPLKCFLSFPRALYLQSASQDRQSYLTLRFRCTNCISKRNIVIESEESLLCKNLIIIMSTALDRFVYITYPLHYHIIMTNRRGKQILISIWVSLSCQPQKTYVK